MNSFWLTQLKFVSDMGDKNFLMVFISISTISYLYLTGHKKESFMVILASLGALISTLLKLIFRQQRPAGAELNFSFDKYGFPSSHTLAYTVFWGYIMYLAFNTPDLPLFLRVIAVLASTYFVVMVGISRVHLGYHYIWDVAAGYVFGILYLVFLILIRQKLG